jgi:hypothetical protein
MRLIRREVVINTKDKMSFRGILWSRWFGVFILKNAQLLENKTWFDIDGEVVILRENIEFLQRLP